MQTANGKVEAQIGVLSSLWLGKTRIKQVDTAFLEDEKLGSNGLRRYECARVLQADHRRREQRYYPER